LGYIVEVLDASLGGKFPVTAISLVNPKNSTLFVSFGAHPVLQVSLERTMTELMQGRGLENLDAFEIPTFDMSIVSGDFNLESHFVDSNGKLGFGFLSSSKSFEFAPWSYKSEGSEAEYNHLTSILASMDKEMYLREYNYLGFYSCQMIIPGFSEVYPMEDLIYNNKNSGKLIRDMILNFRNYDSKDILTHIESLEHELDVEKYIGVIFEHNFNLVTFKAQMYLNLGDFEMALELLEIGKNTQGHIVAELIRMYNSGLQWKEYEEALFDVFGQERVEKAVQIFNGKEFLIDITLSDDYLNILAMYDRLESKKASILKS
jgi:ribosomal protein S12 methylthiotransferase accessory factor